jgi:hypothetical protein
VIRANSIIVVNALAGGDFEFAFVLLKSAKISLISIL